MVNLNHGTAAIDADHLWHVPEAILDLVDEIAPRIFRRETSQPGFVAVDLGANLDAARFRSMLVGFYAAIDGIYLRNFSRRLLLRSIGRFDQKVTSQAHLDGAPAESILMLGYEPTEILSRLSVFDYTRCAADRGLTPGEFLDRFHPGSDAAKEMLEPYRDEVEPFDSAHYRIVIINNSQQPIFAGDSGMLGVLHKSTVAPVIPGQARFINTLLMSPGEAWADDLIAARALRAYIDSGSFATA